MSGQCQIVGAVSGQCRVMAPHVVIECRARLWMRPRFNVTTCDPPTRRGVRRFFALHGACDGVVIAWQPPSDASEEAEPALWRVVLNDGDCEDLEEEELQEAIAAKTDDRSLAQETELILEAAWEALEVSAALFAKREGGELQEAEARERLGDAALLNEQAERAIEEYSAARKILSELLEAGRLQRDDRRLADIEFYLGMSELQHGSRDAARRHYQQAAVTLRLRRAQLQRAALETEIDALTTAAEAGGSHPGGETGKEATSCGEAEEISQIVVEIEQRIAELDAITS